MKKFLSSSKTAVILLIVTVIILGCYACLLARPISYGMVYRNEVVYEGMAFEGTLVYRPDGTVLYENSNFDGEMTGYYYYKDGYVFTLMATTDEEYEAEVAYIDENFEEAVASPFYANRINAFRQVGEGPDSYVTAYTCKGAVTVAVAGGVVELILIVLTVITFILSKKSENGGLPGMIKGCFADEPVNLGRQRELDIAKGLAIIFMVLCHGFEIMCEFFDPEISSDAAYFILDVVLGGSFAAPVFLFCMGIGFAYSRRSGAKDMLRRAGKTACLALLLEIFRMILPGLLHWGISGDPSCFNDYVYGFFSVDILQLATMVLLMMALFKKLDLKPVVMVGIAAVFSVAGQLLQWVTTGSDVGDIVVGYLWKSHDYAYFPLLSWLIFPVCGYAFSSAWQRLEDKETFFRLITPISWAITVVYFASMIPLGEYYLSGWEYYGLGILDAVFALIVCSALIGLGYYLNKWGGCVASWLSSMGNRVTSIYCIHWTILCFLYTFLLCYYEAYIPQWVMLLVSVWILVVSDLSSHIYVDFKKFMQVRKLRDKVRKEN